MPLTTQTIKRDEFFPDKTFITDTCAYGLGLHQSLGIAKDINDKSNTMQNWQSIRKYSAFRVSCRVCDIIF